MEHKKYSVLTFNQTKIRSSSSQTALEYKTYYVITK